MMELIMSIIGGLLGLVAAGLWILVLIIDPWRDRRYRREMRRARQEKFEALIKDAGGMSELEELIEKGAWVAFEDFPGSAKNRMVGQYEIVRNKPGYNDRAIYGCMLSCAKIAGHKYNRAIHRAFLEYCKSKSD